MLVRAETGVYCNNSFIIKASLCFLYCREREKEAGKNNEIERHRREKDTHGVRRKKERETGR